MALAVDTSAGVPQLVRSVEGLSCECCVSCSDLRASLVSFFSVLGDVPCTLNYTNAAGVTQALTAVGTRSSLSLGKVLRYSVAFASGDDNINVFLAHYPSGISTIGGDNDNYVRRWVSSGQQNNDYQDLELDGLCQINISQQVADGVRASFRLGLMFLVKYRTIQNGFPGPFLFLESKVADHSATLLDGSSFSDAMQNPLSAQFANAYQFITATASNYAYFAPDRSRELFTQIYPPAISAPFFPRYPNISTEFGVIDSYGKGEPLVNRMCIDHSFSVAYELNSVPLVSSYSLSGLDGFLLNYLP